MSAEPLHSNRAVVDFPQAAMNPGIPRLFSPSLNSRIKALQQGVNQPGPRLSGERQGVSKYFGNADVTMAEL